MADSMPTGKPSSVWGVFNGITAARHPRSKADKLDPSVVASIALDNKQRRLHHSQPWLLAP
jgi:hypothetical protein